MRLRRALQPILLGHATVADVAPPLNITALSSRDGYSVLECWQLSTVAVDYMSAANYAIGKTTAATWSRIEPRTTAGEAWAPHVQLSIILNGLIRITAPCRLTPDHPDNHWRDVSDGLAGEGRPETEMAYVTPGTLRSSLLIAADLKSASTIAGHFTEFPGNEPTVLIQIPFEGNEIPEHAILHSGPCRE
ncbi:hypothetical protein CHGG_09560 [Chaetomium globosum CBS 148.51]|uniref:Uncharacterized protein n=1 Tax=Chaetomium globosum (strain ATCC 6205 / CBS 148.51 / DSM 1962 / NBRC 6347 / NRRL 1970) TaxID=306901 RepID=Q2GR44_CHAGB|nr:uncharacterized protein CHGG_09560 [Chaetomium globosum CBS 148.51]EAQ85546.1 hypothetical protein CHGG_09560 [Chaetomium globosum CBS 148.51]